MLISENVCFPMCFQWILRVGGASGAPKGRLEGPLRGTLGPKVTTWTHIFAIRIQVRFWGAKKRRCAAVQVGRGERFAAGVGPAEGGEASLQALQRTLHRILPSSSARPATS